MLKPKLGILGGGQLSLMLLEAARDLGYSVAVFCENENEPAAKIADDKVIGSLRDGRELEKFSSKVDLVTYENDFLPFEFLRPLTKVKFVPPLESLEKTSDKIFQKEMFRTLGIPSSRFQVHSNENIQDWVLSITEKFKDQCVFKWARGGYDGKGVFIYRGDLKATINFCQTALEKGIRIFVEEKVNFKREVAMIAVRSVHKQVVFYPLVVSEQDNGICKKVVGPAAIYGIEDSHERMAQEFAQRIGEYLPLFGTFALECFEAESGELLANEIAPRVHNSGHFSMDACEISQFENHWRGILGLPLGSTESAPFFAMLNLIGPAGSSGKSLKPVIESENAAIKLHWYQKEEIRPGRKMGHLNAKADGIEDISRTIDVMTEIENDWISLNLTEKSKR